MELWSSIVFSSNPDEEDFFVGGEEIIIENPRRFGFTPIEYFYENPPLVIENCTPPEEYDNPSHENDAEDEENIRELSIFIKNYFNYHDAPTPIPRKKRCPKKTGILLRK